MTVYGTALRNLIAKNLKRKLDHDSAWMPASKRHRVFINARKRKLDDAASMPATKKQRTSIVSNVCVNSGETTPSRDVRYQPYDYRDFAEYRAAKSERMWRKAASARRLRELIGPARPMPTIREHLVDSAVPPEVFPKHSPFNPLEAIVENEMESLESLVEDVMEDLIAPPAVEDDEPLVAADDEPLAVAVDDDDDDEPPAVDDTVEESDVDVAPVAARTRAARRVRNEPVVHTRVRRSSRIAEQSSRREGARSRSRVTAHGPLRRSARIAALPPVSYKGMC